MSAPIRLGESARTMWDEWFDTQFDLNRCIEEVIRERSKGQPDALRVALWSSVIEHAAEALRSALPDLEVVGAEHAESESRDQR